MGAVVLDCALLNVLHISYTLGEDGSLSSHFLDLQFEYADILQPLAILHLSLVQCGLLYLYLFIEQGQFIVSTDHLCSKNISLIDHLQ